MGLEEWYYSPPLPPYHRIRPDPEAAERLALTQDQAAALPEGVEVYREYGDDGSYLRGRVVLEGELINRPHLSVACRLHRGGTANCQRTLPWLIPAELVDEGLLGPECVLDFDAPGECARCLAPIPRLAPTGRCADRAACDARVEAEERAQLAADFRTFAERVVRDEMQSDTRHYREAIRWAAERLGLATRLGDDVLTRQQTDGPETAVSPRPAGD